jgi:hypothetical protein
MEVINLPGFAINGRGGVLSNKVELLFNHRWIIERLGPIDQRACLVARDLGLPDTKIDRQEVLGGLLYYKFAKSVRWDDAIVTFYDDQTIYSQLLNWQSKVYSVKTGIGQHHPGGGYKMDSVFALTDGEDVTLETIILKNSWPAQISPGKLSYTNSDIKLITVTLAFDAMIGTGEGTGVGAGEGGGGGKQENQDNAGAAGNAQTIPNNQNTGGMQVKTLGTVWAAAEQRARAGGARVEFWNPSQ